MQTVVADRTSPVQRGKWIMEVLIGSPPPPPPPNVPDARRDEAATAERQDAVDARAHGGAPEEPGVQLVPPRASIRSAWRSRTSTRSARGGSRTTASPSTPRGDAVRRHADRRAGRACAQALLTKLGTAHPQLHREPDGVRARPPHRVLRPADHPRDRRKAAPERQPLLVVRAWNREQPGLPDEQGRTRNDDRREPVGPTSRSRGSRGKDDMYITKQHISRRTVLKGMGVTVALPFLDAMVPAGTAWAKTEAAAASSHVAAGRAWRWCTASAGSTAIGVKKNLFAPAQVGRDFELVADTSSRSPRSATTSPSSATPTCATPRRSRCPKSAAITSARARCS